MDSLVKDPEIRLKTEIENTTHQPTTLSLNLCSLYKELNSKTFRYNQYTSITSIRTAPTIIIQTVAKSEEIETNHLGFAKFLFQHYYTYFGLTNNSWPTESVFNCYVNKKIVYHLGGQGDLKSAFNNFFNELLQSITLPQNYLFAPLITEINREIEKYTKQRFLITFADKGKERLQTPAETPNQNPTTYLEETKKAELLGTYDFGAISSWEITDSEEEKSKIKTPVNQTPKNQNNQNSDIVNQHLFPIIQQPQPNLDPMAYAPIAKLKKFTSEEDNTQLMDRIMSEPCKPSHIFSRILPIHDFNAFKIEFLRYFSNNNSINRLANTFTTIKQGENKAVTTYLECFYRNLHQIQAINTNYFTVVQILNQFIHRLCSSILQCICLLHSINLQAAITNTRDFEAAKLKANHIQAINLVINGSSELDSKLKQFKSVAFIIINQSTVATRNTSISSELHTYDTAATLSSTSILSANLLTDNTDNLSATVTTYLSAAASDNLSVPTNSNTTTELISKQNPKAEIDPTKLEIINEDAQPNNPKTNQQPTLTSNILPATITENELLNTIFPFKLKEPLITLLFSGAILKEKPIMAMYTDAKVDGHSIKLILDSGSAGSIITKQLMDQLVNGIMVPIKVLNGQHTCIPVTCGHFKTTNLTTPLIEFEKEEKKPTWEAYQLPPVSLKKERERKKNQQPTTNSNSTYNSYTTPHQSIYCCPKLVCIDCNKKLSSMGTCCGNDEEYTLTTKFYCHPCVIKHFERPKRVGKWDNKPCLAYGETFLDKGIWNDIPGVTSEEIKTIKNNPPKSIELNWDPEPVINLLDPEQFYEHYQELASMREKQKQCLKEINTRLCDHCLIPCDF
ncbi:hypothetical protein G9A89_008159 [Geosiphon pyriformis]|nr:hypothetical protein G9A89_008159 [Geosiphon pyriformis]